MLSEANRKGNATSIVKGVGESSIKDCKTVTFQFSICDLVFHESFIVVPDKSMKYDIVLGDSFLRNLSLIVTVDVGADKPSYSSSEGSWELYFASTEPTLIFRDVVLRTVEDVVMINCEPLLSKVPTRKIVYERSCRPVL